jgi:aryl-alcohol dehydrogenase-like predicted oxidoreductase
LSKPFISALILGLSKKERVDEAIQAIDFKLSKEEIKSIDELYQPKAVISHK